MVEETKNQKNVMGAALEIRSNSFRPSPGAVFSFFKFHM